tara:strand:+ start:2767 stop:3393 length:627 start_codon:yes stop_codon:yes gene_type:complete
MKSVHKRPKLRSRKLYIKKEDLVAIKEFKLPENYEFCGNLEKKAGESALNVVVAGQQGNGPDGRPLCHFNSYSKYIWHTHPRVVPAHPSAEDIIMVCIPNPIVSSVIITPWGVWEIHSRNKHNIPETHRVNMKNALTWAGYDEHRKTPIKKMVDGTENGYTSSVHGAQLTLIQNYINDVERQLNFFKLKIAFTPWSKISGGYTLKFST